MPYHEFHIKVILDHLRLKFQHDGLLLEIKSDHTKLINSQINAEKLMVLNLGKAVTCRNSYFSWLFFLILKIRLLGAERLPVGKYSIWINIITHEPHYEILILARTLKDHHVSSVGCQHHPNTLGIIHSSIHSFCQPLLRVYCLPEAVQTLKIPSWRRSSPCLWITILMEENSKSTLLCYKLTIWAIGTVIKVSMGAADSGVSLEM